MSVAIHPQAAMQAVRGAAKLKLLSETGIALARSLPNTDPSDTVLHALIAQGQLNDVQAAQVLGKLYKIKAIQLKPADLHPEVVGLLSADLRKKHGCVPLSKVGNTLQLAMADPTELAAIKELVAAQGMELDARVAPMSSIEQTFDLESRVKAEKPAPERTPTPAPAPKPALKPAAKKPKAKKSAEKDTAPKGFPLRRRYRMDDPEAVVDVVNDILTDAIEYDVSDIHIEPYRKTARMRWRLDGVMQEQPQYQHYLIQNYAAVMARMKLMAGCDISEKRLPQDGAITIPYQGEEVDFRFNIVPTKYGERPVLRKLQGTPDLTLDKLGFDADDYDKIIEAINAPQGMVLVTGPTGSGKSTTLFACLQDINRPRTNILTAEDPVEYYLEGVGQVQANETIGLTFASILRAFLRQDPEVILVGEIRDKETVDISVKAALTGHLLLSTLHTNDAVGTVVRLLNMGVPNFMIASALSLIVAQRLARKNCKSCRVPDPAGTYDNLIELGFTEEEASSIKPVKGEGCDECGGSGYKGRQGLYEVMKMNKALEKAILDNAQAPELLAAAQTTGFKTMQEIARHFIADGTLSLEEYQRVLVLD